MDEAQKNTQETISTNVTATSANPFHNDADVLTDQGKKFWNAETKGLDESNKHESNKNKILNFLWNIERQGDKYRFASVGQNKPSDSNTVNFFTKPGSTTSQELKDHEYSCWNDN